MFFLLIFSQDRLMILFQMILFLCFCQPPRLFQPPRLLTLEIFANLPVYSALPLCLKLESIMQTGFYVIVQVNF